MAGNANRIDFLKRILADIEGRHLAGNHDQRYRIHVSRGNPGHGVCRTGTGRHQRYANLPGRPRQTVCRMDSSLLVPDQHVLDLILFEQLVIQVQNGTARIAEHIVDLFFLQAPDYNLCTGH